jgi:hypothetical protein
MAKHKPVDDLETSSEATCIADRLRAALGSGPGAASERPDSASGTIERVMAIWPSLTYGGKLEAIESADRATCLVLWQDLCRNAPLIVEV